MIHNKNEIRIDKVEVIGVFIKNEDHKGDSRLLLHGDDNGEVDNKFKR